MDDGGKRGMLDDAIRKLVADAIADGGIVDAGREGARLAARHPDAGMTRAEIVDAVVRAAVAAGVAAEITRPEVGAAR